MSVNDHLERIANALEGMFDLLKPRIIWSFPETYLDKQTAIDNSEYGAIPIAGDMVATKMICKKCGKKKWSGESAEAYREICNECYYKNQSSPTSTKGEEE